MNQLRNPKIDLSLTLLAENSKAIVEQKLSPDSNVIRALVDERRQIKADIQIQKTQFDAAFTSTDSISDEMNEEAEDFVANWITGLKSAPVSIVDFENEHFCEIFLDQILPKVWHFKNNAIVIIDPPSETISNCAKGRGQHHIITYYSGEKTDRCVLNETTKPGNLICKSLEDLEKAFALIQIPAGQVITIPCTPQTEEDQQSDATVALPHDNQYSFKNGDSVQYWLDYQPESTDGVENLRNAAARAIRQAGTDARARRYWSYHLARATFFAGQGAAAVLNYRLFDSSKSDSSSTPSSSSSYDLNLLDNDDGSDDVPETPLATGGFDVLFNFIGSIFPEAVARSSNECLNVLL